MEKPPLYVCKALGGCKVIVPNDFLDFVSPEKVRSFVFTSEVVFNLTRSSCAIAC